MLQLHAKPLIIKVNLIFIRALPIHMANVCKPLLSRKGFPPLTDLKFRLNSAGFPERRGRKTNFFFLRAWNTNHPDGKLHNSGIQRTRRAGAEKVMSDSGKKGPRLSQFDQVSGTW